MKTKPYRHYKALDQLSSAHLAEIIPLLRDPRHTVDAMHDWLRERGYSASRSSAWRLMRKMRTDPITRQMLHHWGDHHPSPEVAEIAALLPSLTPRQLAAVAQIIRAFLPE